MTNITSNETQVCGEATADVLYVEFIGSIITPIICGVGIFFNILNVVVTFHRPFKGSLYTYLIALSIIDGIFLLAVLPKPAFRCGITCLDPPLSAQVYEKFVYLPLANTFVTADMFITVTWAVQRLVLIHKPGALRDDSDFAYISVAVSLFSSFVIHIPYFAMWTVDYESGRTIPTYFNKSNMDLYYGIVLMVITKAIPIAILILANCLLLWAVRKATFKRKTLHNQTTIQDKDLRLQTRITLILVSVICLMLVGNIPVTFTYPAFSESFFGHCLETSKNYRIFRMVSNTLEQLAFSLNFIIYYTMNRNFKRILPSLLCCKKEDSSSDSDPVPNVKRNQVFHA